MNAAPARFDASAPSPRRLTVIQGARMTSDDPNVIMSTILGSCVAACLYDSVRGVGGMNHFLLSESASGALIEDEALRYGAYAMEVLINDLMKLGANRNGLICKLFGGAKMYDSRNEIGAANVAFARRFLADEGISIAASSVGGTHARRVEFWPVSGRARQREVEHARTPTELVAPIQPAIAASGGVELF